MNDYEASRKRTYFYCDNPAHDGLVRQTFFTEPERFDVKCIGCGAVMTYGRYTDNLEIGWFRVAKSGVFFEEVRAMDQTQMKFVMKIQNLIKQAEEGTVPRALYVDLKVLLDDYLKERIKSLRDLRLAIEEIINKTSKHILNPSAQLIAKTNAAIDEYNSRT